MPTIKSRVKVYVDAGDVVIKHNEKIIKRMEYGEALECAGNIKKAGEIAESSPEKVVNEPVTGAKDMQKNSKKNRSNSQSSRARPKHKSKNNKKSDWKSTNKNHLISGHM